MSSLQRRFGLPTDLTPFICHSVLQLSFHFVLVTYWTMSVTLVPCLMMSVTLVLCLMMVLRILTFSLTISIFLSMARWLLSSFFTNAFVRDHVWHPYVIAGKTHWLKTFLFILMGRCLFRKIRMYFRKILHPAFIHIETSCFVVFHCYCLSQIYWVTFSISV